MRMARASATVGVVIALGMAGLAVATRTTGVDATVAMTFGVQALLGPMFAVIGAIVLRRHPTHAMGWFCLGIGVTSAIDEGLRGLVTAQPLPTEEAWVVAATIVADVTGMLAFASLIVFLPLIFPNGHPASPRWRWVVRSGVVLTVVSVLLSLMEPGALEVWEGKEVMVSPTNPLGLDIGVNVVLLADAVAIVAMFWFLAGIASLVVRYRSDRTVRQQIKWVLFGSFMAMVGVLLTAIPALMAVGDLVSSLAFAAIPASIGLAITRYRLYDIDRVFSRTLAYAIVLTVLAGVYAGSVLAFSTLTRRATGDASDLVVAISTLLAAAAFQPLRRRILRTIDRRFNRGAYDAQQTLDGLSRRLRDQVDSERIVTDLQTTVSSAVQPCSVRVVLFTPSVP